MKTGISLYFSNGVERNKEMIDRVKRAGIQYAFTSMHIPEESGVNYGEDTKYLLRQCKEAFINRIVDISPHTLEKLGCSTFDELLDLGIIYIRLAIIFIPSSIQHFLCHRLKRSTAGLRHLVLLPCHLCREIVIFGGRFMKVCLLWRSIAFPKTRYSYICFPCNRQIQTLYWLGIMM